MQVRIGIVALAISAALAGCGGGGGDGGGGGGGGGGAVQNQSVGGIWSGTNPENGVSVDTVALVSPSGEYFAASLNESNNCETIETGNATVSGSSYSASIQAAVVTFSTSSTTNTGCAYPDGSTWAHGTISGSVTTGTSLSLNDNLVTSGGETLPSDTGTLTFNTLYNEPSSLSKIAGNWMGPTGDIQSVNSDGTYFEQDPQSGCVINGHYSIIDSTKNIYSGSATYANCAGSAAVLNGLTATGLFTIDDQVSPAELTGGGSVTLSDGTVIVAVGTSTKD